MQLSVQYRSTGDNISIETCSNRNNGEQGLTVIPFLSMRERMECRGNYSRHSLLSPQDSANKRPQIIAMRKKDRRERFIECYFLCVRCRFQKFIETIQIFRRLQTCLKNINFLPSKSLEFCKFS